MKKSLIIAAIFAAVLAVSCQNKELVEEPAQTEPVIKTFVLELPSDSKASVSLGGKVTWEPGDEILIHTGHIRAGEFTTVELSASDIFNDGKSARISFEALTTYDWISKGWTETPGVYSDYYAAYPAMTAAFSGTWYCRSFFSNTNQFLMAACDNEGAFRFYNLCSIITFSASGDYDSFIFSGNRKEVIGYDIYGVEILKGSQNFRYSSSSGEQTKIEAEFVKNGTNYVYIPGGANLADGFTIHFIKNGSIVKEAKSTAGVNLGHNDMLNLGDISAHVKDYSAPSTSDHKSDIPTAGAIDLSAEGTANCYVVSAAGTYKFPAYKGNTKELAGEVFDVELLWETQNNKAEIAANSVIAAVDFENNWIYFQTASTLQPGNALIAAKNNMGKIIWSWHIWIPQTAFTTVTEDIFAPQPAMSRNLGALIDTPESVDAPVESFGLLYQWGRKDPFPGIGDFGHSNPIALTHPVTFTNAQTTIQGAIENPTVFYWLASSDWQNELSSASSDSPNAGTLWGEAKKTVYDPCPPGYCMPARATTAFWDKTQLVGQTYFTCYNANYSFKVGSLMFPLAGIIYHSSGGYNKLFTMVWSGRWDSGTAQGYGMYGDAYSDPNSFRREAKARCTGGSVRCIVQPSE